MIKIRKLGNSKFKTPSLEVIRMNQYRLLVLFLFILISVTDLLPSIVVFVTVWLGLNATPIPLSTLELCALD